MWESLVFRVFREHEIAGSNPAILTGASRTDDDLMRWVLCWHGKAAVNRPDAGSIPASAALTNGRASQLAMAPRSNRDELDGLEGSTPSLSAFHNVLLAERQRLRSSKPARRVRFPQGTLSI